MSHSAFYAQACDSAIKAGRRRELTYKRQSKTLVDFSSNDYLALSRHPQLMHMLRRGADRWGIGATGSRLLSGNDPLQTLLERRIARSLHAESALIFPSGYQLNATVIAALLERTVLGGESAVFCDRFVHASIHHGCRLAGVQPRRFRHNDLDQLEALLVAEPPHRPRFIIAESLYGMDGDYADVRRLQSLAQRYNALLYIDEAHAVGIAGSHGYGICNSIDERTVVMGSFSKALGTAGAYVACSKTIQQYLIQRCTGFIYTTALAPPLTAAAWAAWHLLPTLQTERDHLAATAAFVRNELRLLGLDIGNSTSHLIPIILGDAQRTLQAQATLRERGFLVSAIRPPTVPPQSSRLRIALTIRHSAADLHAFILACRDLI